MTFLFPVGHDDRDSNRALVSASLACSRSEIASIRTAKNDVSFPDGIDSAKSCPSSFDSGNCQTRWLKGAVYATLQLPRRCRGDQRSKTSPYRTFSKRRTEHGKDLGRL
jgi:hypothetical protein